MHQQRCVDMATVTPTLNFSSSSAFQFKTPQQQRRLFSSAFHFSPPPLTSHHHQSLHIRPKPRARPVSAVVGEEPVSVAVAEEPAQVEEAKADDADAPPSPPAVKSCELYICNIPSSCDETQLTDMFTPHGSVLSVQISRNLETGISKGCGYVTMSSMREAIAAVIALDESDFGGREMRVKFTDDMNKKKNMEIFDSITKKSTIFETPHKLYVGNLVWSIKSEFLRDHFSQYGTVVSVRVIHDRKAGNNRVYGFISFSTEDELKAALSSNGTELRGRKMVTRNALSSEQPK